MPLNLTASWAGLGGLLGFGVAYAEAMTEERLQVRKSVPVLVAAALVWLLVGMA